MDSVETRSSKPASGYIPSRIAQKVNNVNSLFYDRKLYFTGLTIGPVRRYINKKNTFDRRLTEEKIYENCPPHQ
jgi:hypothetical protein